VEIADKLMICIERRALTRSVRDLVALTGFEQGTPSMEIIGVAKNGLYRSLYEDYQPYMFLPVYQQQHGAVTILISAKCAADLPAVTASAWS